MNRHVREILKEKSVAQNILLNLGIPQIAPCTYFPFSDKQLNNKMCLKRIHPQKQYSKYKQRVSEEKMLF